MTSALREVSYAHERILDELEEKPMSVEDMTAATGLAFGMVLATLRTLERGGRVRYSRKQYELVRNPGTIERPGNGAETGSVATPPQIIQKIIQPSAAMPERSSIRAAPEDAPTSETKSASPETMRPIDATKPPPAETIETIGATTGEDETMEMRTCSRGAACIDGTKPKPPSSFYGKEALCKRCRYERQKASKARARAARNGAGDPGDTPRARKSAPAAANGAGLNIPAIGGLKANEVEGLVHLEQGEAKIRITVLQMRELAAWGSKL